MWHKLTYLILVLGLGWPFGGQALWGALAEDHYVGVIKVNGSIDPISARYLARGIERATADGAKLVVIKLDTPGGLLSSTRNMVESILGAGIPVAVYVAPPGAQAASAGTYSRCQ